MTGYGCRVVGRHFVWQAVMEPYKVWPAGPAEVLEPTGDLKIVGQESLNRVPAVNSI
jgi:hypothetical protein